MKGDGQNDQSSRVCLYMLFYLREQNIYIIQVLGHPYLGA